ncbi:MAG: phosphatase PAP2 family protein [Bacteroidales bacterium]|jgi:undecaprenyl-diphosphatase|nr:phosphatase PAP2 family protein [Bacteroidales bacterium]
MNEIDHNIFLFLNSIHSPFFDEVMRTVSLRTVWIPLYMFIVYLLVVKYRKRIWLILLLAAVLVFLTDQVSNIIKDFFERPRPCHEPSLAGLVHTVGGRCGGMYGFVSAHAANTFGVASFTAPLISRKWFTWTIYSWAVVVSYSRIYLGVHYPGDVLGGAILGFTVGTVLAWTFVKTDKLSGSWTK